MVTNDLCGFKYEGEPILSGDLVFEKLIKHSNGGIINTLYITRNEETRKDGNAEVRCTFREPNGLEITNFEVKGTYQWIGDEIVDNLRQVNENPRYIEPKLREKAKAQIYMSEQRKVSRKYHQVMTDLGDKCVAIFKMLTDKPPVFISPDSLH